MFAYCGNDPVRYNDYSGTIIEEFTFLDAYNDAGQLVGFTVDYDERFLDPVFCLEFGRDIVLRKGYAGLYLGMSAERIAVELFAHAKLNEIGSNMPDAISSDSLALWIDPITSAAIMMTHRVKKYLIEHAAQITVNNDESGFRMAAYSYLWKKETGRSWRQNETNTLCPAGRYANARWREETR